MADLNSLLSPMVARGGHILVIVRLGGLDLKDLERGESTGMMGCFMVGRQLTATR